MLALTRQLTSVLELMSAEALRGDAGTSLPLNSLTDVATGCGLQFGIPQCLITGTARPAEAEDHTAVCMRGAIALFPAEACSQSSLLCIAGEAQMATRF